MTISDRDEADRTLEAMVSAIDDDGSAHQHGTALILTLGGQVVSGQLIPAWQWFEEVAEERAAAWTASGGDAEGSSVEGTISKLAAADHAKQRDEQLGHREAVESLPTQVQRDLYKMVKPEYIHLRGARVFVAGGGSLPTNRPMYWRGRLSHVAGWAFGALTGPDSISS